MNDGQKPLTSARPQTRRASAPSSDGTLVSWTASSGDGKKSHVVHVDSSGLAWALNIKEKDSVLFGKLVGEATARPSEAAELIAAYDNRSRRIPREQIAKITYVPVLDQLIVVDDAGKKKSIPQGKEGKEKVLKKIFAAAGQHLGGMAGEEDADAWSVMKSPLMGLATIAFIGGMCIYMAAGAHPNYEPTGRRAGFAKLINWLGYTIGPTVFSVVTGVLALLVVGITAYLLINRPKRQVLTFNE
jgi:hypothetical protein